jgi:LBP / BPI / CETP family, C-terminal domain
MLGEIIITKFVLSVLVVCSLVSGSIIGVKFGVPQTVFENYKNASIPYYLSNITTNALFDSYQFTALDGILKLDVTINQARIYYYYLNQSLVSIKLDDSQKILVEAPLITFFVKFLWKYSGVADSDSGQGFISIRNSNLNASLSLEINSEGIPSIYTNYLIFKIAESNLTFSGNKNTQLLNTLSFILQNKIKNKLENVIEDYLETDFIESISAYILETQALFNIGGGISISYALTQNPIISQRFLEVDSLGIFIVTSSPNYNPPVQGNYTLPTFVANNSQVQLSFSEYSLNTLAYSMYELNFFSLTLNQSELPNNTMFYLDTTHLDALFPGIGTYGTDVPCDVIISTIKSPQVLVSPSSNPGVILLNATLNLEVFVAGGIEQTAIILESNIQMNVNISLSQPYVKSNIQSAGISNLMVKSQNYNSSKEIDIDGMTGFINLAINFSLPIIDDYLFRNGFKLPIPKYTTMTNSTVTIKQGYFYILSTPTFNFPV